MVSIHLTLYMVYYILHKLQQRGDYWIDRGEIKVEMDYVKGIPPFAFCKPCNTVAEKDVIM